MRERERERAREKEKTLTFPTHPHQHIHSNPSHGGHGSVAAMEGAMLVSGKARIGCHDEGVVTCVAAMEGAVLVSGSHSWRKI